MNFDEKKEELSFAHKLEVRRIWLSRSLAAGVTILVGLIAFLVAPRFAHELKIKEFQYQRELDAAKLWETTVIEKALEGFSLIDSLHREALDTYGKAVSHFERRGDSADVVASANAVYEVSLRFFDAARKYSSYWDDDFSMQVISYALLFRAVTRLEKGEWVKFIDFFVALRRIGYKLQLGIVEQKILNQELPIRQDLFRLPMYKFPNSSYKDDVAYGVSYLRDSYDKWISWKNKTNPAKE